MNAKQGPTAPLQIELQAELNAPQDEVFEWMTNRLPEWFAKINNVTYDNTKSVEGSEALGVQSVRTCQMGKKAIVEVITDLVPGERYRYRTDMERSTMKMPIRDHEGAVRVAAGKVDGTSVVAWQQYFIPPRGPLGTLIRWNMREKMMRPGLGELVANLGGRVRK